MYICIQNIYILYIYIYIYIYTHIDSHTHTHTHLHTQIYTFLHVHTTHTHQHPEAYTSTFMNKFGSMRLQGAKDGGCSRKGVRGRGGGLGSRPKKMYGEYLGDGVE